MDQHATDLLTDWAALRSGVPPVWARYTDLIVERASGSWIETVDGVRYLDYTCGIGVTNTGHAHPHVVAAIAEQAARGIHLQQNIVYHQPGLELHRRLPERFPNAAPETAYGLFLSNSGAEAVEAAIKLAKYVTRRPNVITVPRWLPRPDPRRDGADDLEREVPVALRAVDGWRALRAVPVSAAHGRDRCGPRFHAGRHR